MTSRLDRLGRRTSIAVGAAISLVSTVLVVPALAAGAAATPNPAPESYKLTVAARYCPDYPYVYKNRNDSNLTETYEPLGPSSPYPGAFPVNPTTEGLGPQNACAPMSGWRFTLGTGISGGSPADLSVVTGKYDTNVVTETSTPELKPDGTPNGTETVAGARTITLTKAQADLAQKSSQLWIQGGVPGQRPTGQLNGQQDQYAFASLRCAVDALNGDNVEWIQYTGGAKHVFCYAYYVDATDYGTIQLKKKTLPSTPGVDFTFGSNVSYGNNGDFTLAGNGSTQEFKRATTEDSGTTWFFEEKNLPQGWALDDITCTTTKGSEWDVDGKRVSIDLVKNDKVVCTYTNAKAATVTVTKKTEGDTDVNDGSTTTFPVTVDGAAVPLKGGQSETVTVGDLGDDSRTITVDEGDLQDGWTRTDLMCTRNGRGIDDADPRDSARGFQVEVEAGDDVDCVVTNSFTADPAIITITKKVTGGSNPAEDFGFSLEKADLDGDGATTEDFGLNGGESETFSIKAKDSGRAVTISEDSLPAGWTLTGSSCTGLVPGGGALGLPGGGDPTDPIELTVRPGEVWNCEFTNDRDTATLVLHKVVADGAEASFEITPQVDGAPLTPVTLELDGVTASSDPITIPVDGSTAVGATEADQSTWHLEDAYCTVTPADSKTGDRQYPDAAFPAYDESSVTPTASGVGRGDRVDCWFMNERNTAEVVVLKQVVEGDEADAEGLGWEFPVTSGDATLATVEATTASKGKATIVVTDEGTPVTVTETQRDGWSLESLTCEVAGEGVEPSSVLDDTVVTPSAGATLVDGDVLECTAVNGRDRASITVYKVATDAYGKPAVVPFQVTDSTDEAAVEVLPGGDGVVFDYALPAGGTTVTIRELAQTAWQPVEIVCTTDTASQGPLSFDIETFDAGVVASSTGSLSVDVPLADGDDISCTIYNQQESGIVRVDKVAAGAGELEFGFTATGAYGEGTQEFDLADGDANEVLVYPAGTVVSISETDDRGWVLDNVTCAPTEPVEDERVAPAAVVTPGTGIQVGAGSDITCTFTNVPADPGISIEKAASRGPGEVNQEANDFFDNVAGVAGAVTVYRYQVRNTGNVPLSGIVLTDDLNYGPTLGSSVTALSEAALTNCRVGTEGTPNAGLTGITFTPGQVIEGLTVQPGQTYYLFCDLLVPDIEDLPNFELNRIFDVATVSGTPETSTTPITEVSNPVVVKVFEANYGAFPLKNIVDEETGTNYRAFDDLGEIVTITPRTFRMTVDNTSNEPLSITLYDYYDNTSTGLTTAQRDALFNSMKCINYDNPAKWDGFPDEEEFALEDEVFSPAQVTTFGPTTNGGGAGTFLARSYDAGTIGAGEGFEIACKVFLPPGQYAFTNVFRMVANPAPFADDARVASQGTGVRGAAVVAPMADAPSGAIDLTAQAGIEAGDPVDPVTPTPTPTPTVEPTEPATPTPTVTPTGSDNPGPLPQTGGNVGTLAVLGAAGLLAGILLMILGGRRRDEDTAGGHL
jgi:LPXTG-motif cell wall-anchored protein